MPDFPAPVAAAADPNQTLRTLSGIIGLQQQRQTLQTGQYLQQSAQAEAKIRQQDALENQNVATALQDPVKAGITDQFGNLTPNAQGIYSHLSPTHPEKFDAYAKAATSKVQYQNASLGLEQNVRNTVNARATAAANAEGATPEDVQNAYAQIKKEFAGTQEEGSVNRWADIAAERARTVAGPHGMEGVKKVVGEQSIAGLPLGDIALLKQATTGAGMVNVQPVSGAVSAPPGAAPGTPLNPTPVQVAGQQAAIVGQTGTDNAVFGQVMAAGKDSARGIELAQKIEQEAAQVRTGKYTGEFANRLTVLQQHDPSITARQLLQKDTENLKSLAEGTATTDQERQQIGGGFPSPDTMDPDAVAKAARYWQGSFKLAAARSANATAHVTQNGTAGLTLKDQAFMKDASPGKFAPAEPKKSMPTGAKLTNYAKTKFGGDTGKATAFLKQQGYE